MMRISGVLVALSGASVARELVTQVSTGSTQRMLEFMLQVQYLLHWKGLSPTKNRGIA